MSDKKGKGVGWWILQIVMVLLALIVLLPVFILLNYSFKTRRELYLSSPLSLPEHFSFENYANAFVKLNLGTAFFNTAFYTIFAVVLLAIICGAAAWAIARSKGKFFKFSYFYFIIGILLPAQALFLPIYIVGYNLGWVNSRIGIILMYVATGTSFGVFLMTSFMSTVPVELEEAARIDGYSIYRIFFIIVVPLLRPVMATLIILQAFSLWNEYLMSSLFISRNSLKTITLVMQTLFMQYSSDYSTAFAGVILSVLPLAILFVCLQKYFIKGLTVGAVKG